MIVDCHSHVGRYSAVWSEKLGHALLQQFGKFPTWWDRDRNWTLADFGSDVLEKSLKLYVSHMDELGIDRTAIMGLACEPFDIRTPPEFIQEAIMAYPDRLIGMHALDPIGYPDHGPKELHRSVEKLGFKGVKIYCGYNNAAPDDPRLFPVYAKAAELSIPVFIHTGYTCTHAGPGAYAPLSRQSPLLVEPVAAQFPELRIVMTHFGNPWSQDAIQIMRKYDNVYADTAYGAFPISWKASTLAWAKQFGVLDRVLFGSDYPLHSPRESVELHRSLPRYMREHGVEPELSLADIATIFSNGVGLFDR